MTPGQILGLASVAVQEAASLACRGLERKLSPWGVRTS